MSIEIWNTLLATVSGTTVTLTWSKNDPGFPPVTAFAVQRKLFGRGDDNWTTLSSGISATGTSFSYADAVGAVGDWAYRVVATVTQGGVDALGTSIYSNQVNVTTEAATGEVTLTLVQSIPRGQPTYTQIDLSWTIAGTAVDVRHYQVQVTTDSGAHWRDVGELDEFEGTTFTQLIPNGTGLYFWRVIAHLPSATPPYNADVLSTSNSVTATV